MAIANGTCVSFCNQPKARFPLAELTGDRFPLSVNTGSASGNRAPVNTARVEC